MRPLLAPALLLALVLPANALADQTGGVSPGSGASTGPTGGVSPGSVHVPSKPRPRPRPRRQRRRRRWAPSVVFFSVSPATAYLYGRSARVRFELSGGGRPVRITLVVDRPGHGVLRRIDLGPRRTGAPQSYALSGLDLPEGSFQLRLWARGLRRASEASSTGTLGFRWHRFPLVGEFAYGNDAGGRFGAPRPGHVHQGQDIPAPAGTPVVAPRGGIVKVVSFQAAGAGNYVVLHGDGNDFDYVFMHLLDGSVRVSEGQHVYTGQQLAQVGSTGESSGPHLHFEVWQGPWGAGGHPVDPLPYLRQWDAWS